MSRADPIPPPPTPPPQNPNLTLPPTYTVSHRGRHWQVRDADGELVCVTVYKCGADEVVRRLKAAEQMARMSGES